LVVSIVGGIYIFQLVWGIVGYFSDIFLMLLLAWILSFVFEPVALRLIKSGFSRIYACVTIYILLTIFIAIFVILLVPIISSQLKTVTENLPQYLSALSISQSLSARIQEVLTTLLSNSLFVVTSIASFLFSLFVVLFMSFYFLLEREKIISFAGKFVPNKFKDELRFISWAVSTSFATFIRVQLLLGLISGIITLFTLAIFGIDYALSASVLAGFLTVIPVVGSILALLPPLVAAASKGIDIVFAVAVVLTILQFIQFNILGQKFGGRLLKFTRL